MKVYGSEAEQIEAIKSWWQKYSTVVVVAVGIGIASSFIWRWHETKQQTIRENASLVYEQMSRAVAVGDQSRVTALAAELVKQHRNSPYAVLGALKQAQNFVQQGELAHAEQALTFALQHSKDQALTQLIRVRLARVQLAQQQPQAALATLVSIDDNSSFIPLAAEARGDSYAALQHYAQAREAYQLASSQVAPNSHPLLTLKWQQVIERGGNS